MAGETLKTASNGTGWSSKLGRRTPLSVLGLRAVHFVRVRAHDAGLRYEVVGIGHRMPVARAIPRRLASHLVAGGLPLVGWPVGQNAELPPSHGGA